LTEGGAVSDFDDVLERLVTEPHFRAALASDPAGTLAGYQLSADELDLLGSQLAADDGGAGPVEERTSKASLAGLIAPLTGLFGGSPQGHLLPTGHSSGQGLSDIPADQGISDTGADQALSDVPADQGLSDVAPDQGLHSVSTPNQGLSDIHSGGQLQVSGSGDHTPVGYHPHIDADGDGHWDRYTAVQHADGSVDIEVDRNHDGVVDFVGHDRDHDGRVESADYDEDFNGSFETHLRDVNGDGWLDVRTVDPQN
jgi:hypothetical protein